LKRHRTSLREPSVRTRFAGPALLVSGSIMAATWTPIAVFWHLLRVHADLPLYSVGAMTVLRFFYLGWAQFFILLLVCRLTGSRFTSIPPLRFWPVAFASAALCTASDMFFHSLHVHRIRFDPSLSDLFLLVSPGSLLVAFILLRDGRSCPES
jgi:hypothetical protein